VGGNFAGSYSNCYYLTVFQGKNNLTIHGKKFSGNSAHIQKNRVLHHGTMLYKTDLKKLDKIIRF